MKMNTLLNSINKKLPFADSVPVFKINIFDPEIKEIESVQVISDVFWDTKDPISGKRIKYWSSMKPNQVSIGGRYSFKTTTNALK
jgi:hypothetical protein